MNLFVCSNGHGEDGIALKLIQAFKQAVPLSSVTILPLVGAGYVYKNAGFDVILDNPIFPSGGFIRDFSSLSQDVKAGLITHLFKQKKTAGFHSGKADIVLCVGDVFCLWMGKGKKARTFFLPTAKSDAFMEHSKLEIWLLKQWCTKVFPRDDLTLNSLKNAGVPAEYFGNPMMDGLKLSGQQFLKMPGSVKIGVLPGSRQEAYANLTYILSLPFSHPTSLFLAKSPALDAGLIENILLKSGWIFDSVHNKFTQCEQKLELFITDCLEDAVFFSDVVIGLAGTANEQAVFMGKKVVCFEGFGPQSTLKRFYEQRQLMGDPIVVVEQRNPGSIMTVLESVLKTAPVSEIGWGDQHAASHIVHSCLAGL